MIITRKKFPNENTSIAQKVFVIYLGGIIFFSFLFLIIYFIYEIIK